MRQAHLILSLLATSVLVVGSPAKAQMSPFGEEAIRIEGPAEAIPAVLDAYLRQCQEWSGVSPEFVLCGAAKTRRPD